MKIFLQWKSAGNLVGVMALVGLIVSVDHFHNHTRKETIDPQPLDSSLPVPELDSGLGFSAEHIMDDLPDPEDISDEERAAAAKWLAEHQRVHHPTAHRSIRARRHLEAAFDAMDTGHWLKARQNLKRAEAAFEPLDHVEEEKRIISALNRNFYTIMAKDFIKLDELKELWESIK